MEYKKCGHCKKEFPATVEYFHRDKNGSYGLHSYCKKCRNKIRKSKYKNEKENGIPQLHYKYNKLQYVVNNMNRRGKEKITLEEVERRLEEFIDDEGKLHCMYCKRLIEEHDMMHIEHYIPLAKGGQNTTDNILPVCRYCNRSKMDEEFTYWYRNQLFYDKNHEQYILDLMNQKQVA